MLTGLLLIRIPHRFLKSTVYHIYKDLRPGYHAFTLRVTVRVNFFYYGQGRLSFKAGFHMLHKSQTTSYFTISQLSQICQCTRSTSLPNVFLGELETLFYLGLGGTGTKQLEEWLPLSRLFYLLPWESSSLKKQKLKVNTEVFLKGPPTEIPAGEPEVAL